MLFAFHHRVLDEVYWKIGPFFTFADLGVVGDRWRLSERPLGESSLCLGERGGRGTPAHSVPPVRNASAQAVSEES